MALSGSQVSTPVRLTLLLASTVILVGCHRQFYRKQADLEAHSLIDEKASHVARPPNAPIRVDVDRRSRMFNPFDLDFQPMPLDDPAAYKYMQCVDGRRGYPMWEAAGFTNTAENPDWWQFLPMDDDGVLVLNSENAVRIALLHSPDYQQQVESLYLAALNVSAERFNFDTQFFGGAGTNVDYSQDSTVVSLPTDLELRRAFATGGNLVASMANSIVWELSGPNSNTASTLLDFSLVQPLLRGAGRDRVLEGLTFVERSLLYNIRQFERYRRSFFLDVTIGRGVESSVQTALRNVAASSAGLGVGGGGAGGFLGLLQDRLRIRNSEENIARQTENLLILEDSLVELLTTIPDDAETIVRQRLQVAQARQQLLTSQSRLVDQQAGFQRSIDAFLRTLGLPPYICVKIDDPFLDRFELIDRELLTRREQLSALRTNVGSINVSILERGEFKLDPDTGLPVSQIQWTPELAELLDALRTELQPLAEFSRELIEKDMPIVEKDIENLAAATPERQRQNKSLEDLYRTEQASICGLLNVSEVDESIFQVERLASLSKDLQDDYAKLSERLRKYQERIDALEKAFENLSGEGVETIDPRELALRLRDEIILASQDLVAELGDDVLALQLIQARARTESVILPEVDIAPEVALEIARKNRRDWANARGVLVDAWRNIEFVADDLESGLDIVVNGSISNDGENLFNLDSNTGNLSLALQWDAPITRLLERNDYRRALIQYEQAKRRFYGFEDTIWQLLRAEVRQLQADRFTFELGRQSVRIAAQQIELNADIRALNDARGRSSGPTAARDAISALADLLNAQNGLLDIFVNYEIVRRGLEFDLGTMELTPEGLWIDPGKLSPDVLMSLPGTTSDGLIETGRCNDCGFPYHPLPVEPYFGSMLKVGHVQIEDGEAEEIEGGYGEAVVPTDEIPIDQVPVDPVPAPQLEPPSPSNSVPPPLPAPVR